MEERSVVESHELRKRRCHNSPLRSQMVGLEEKPIHASWSKLTNHVMPEKAKSGGTVECDGLSA
jgi:hypothetical protein